MNILIINYWTENCHFSVPLNKIKTGKELLNVFYNVKMNHKVFRVALKRTANEYNINENFQKKRGAKG